jgi:hypothetical protein
MAYPKTNPAATRLGQMNPDDITPRLLPEDYLFCETGTLLTLNFLLTANAVAVKAWGGWVKAF